MKSSLRNVERKTYAQPKHDRAKKKDRKTGHAIIVDSGNTTLKNSRNLIIGHDLFKPQGKPAAGNVYYECKVKGCRARATISETNLKIGLSCAVILTNVHNHDPEMESLLVRGGYYSDSEVEEEAGRDFGTNAESFVEENISAENNVGDDSILEFVDVENITDADDESMPDFLFIDVNNNPRLKSEEAVEEEPSIKCSTTRFN